MINREPNSRIASMEEVHSFYERMPYPAPLTSLEEHRDLYKNPDRRRVQFHLLWPRERLPPGFVAVLINRAHPFTDLVLTVDKSEDRLLLAIDGKKTIDEILRVTGNAGNASWALKFFERLWQYDQIVIDPSRTRQ
jgi:hypothetical protein